MLKIFCISVLCLALYPLGRVAAEPSEKLLFEKQSLYQYISVVEDTVKKERYVRNQKRDYAQGGIYLNAPDKLLFEFTQMGFASLAFMERDPADVLFLGLGAGAMPRYFSKYYPNANSEVAEIDADMLSVAKKYFYFKENEKMKVHIDDGRLFLKKTRKKYDWIILDAYQNDYIPFHLTTLEFLREVKNHLNDNGVVVANITSSYRNKFFDSMVMTYKKAFPNFYIIKGKKSSNFIFVGTSGRKIRDQGSVEARARKIQSERRFDIDLEDFASRYEPSETYEWAGAKVLTDDFAPVNLYQHQKSGAR